MTYIPLILNGSVNRLRIKTSTTYLNTDPDLLEIFKLFKHHICPFSTEACHTVVRGIVCSHLDYANFAGLPECEISKLQRVQNITAKFVLNRTWYDSSEQARGELHWLPIRARIQHKVLCLMYKSLNGMAPQYLQDLITLCPVARLGLRSEKSFQQLFMQFIKWKTLASRAFSSVAPRWWNQLPRDIKKSQNIECFKAKHLFKEYYKWLSKL